MCDSFMDMTLDSMACHERGRGQIQKGARTYRSRYSSSSPSVGRSPILSAVMTKRKSNNNANRGPNVSKVPAYPPHCTPTSPMQEQVEERCRGGKSEETRTSTGPLSFGLYFRASSPSPYPFGLSICSV